MDVNTLLDWVVNNSLAVVITIYFLWKDSKLTKENTEILQQVKALLLVLTEGGDK